MIAALSVIVAGQLMAIIFLLDRKARDSRVIANYRSLMSEVVLYLHDKSNGRDFALWREEFNKK